MPPQLILKSQTRYYAKGTIIADSSEKARGLMVITSGQVDRLYISLHYFQYGYLIYVVSRPR
jgi:hypothetical protein